MEQKVEQEQTMEQLLADPRFQNLYAKAESHQEKFRPKETARLQESNQLESILQQRTKACWDSLTAARRAGMTLMEAQEVAFPLILLPGEKD